MFLPTEEWLYKSGPEVAAGTTAVSEAAMAAAAAAAATAAASASAFDFLLFAALFLASLSSFPMADRKIGHDGWFRISELLVSKYYKI